jgi:hypothetical protein
MTNDRNPNFDPNSHDNDNDAHEHKEKTPGAVASVPTGGALTSQAALEALSTALNKVNTTAFGGWLGKLLMSFKSREGGDWRYGPKQTNVEEGSQWAANPLTFEHGHVCFSDDKKRLGERMVSVGQPISAVEDLPDLGFPWQGQWAVNLKCTTGIDAGTEVVFKTTTDGGRQTILGLIDKVRNRLNDGQHDGKVVPILRLDRDSYQHMKYGRVWTPVLTIIEWVPLSGPTPAPKPVSPSPTPTSPTTEQPRRRRVA